MNHTIDRGDTLTGLAGRYGVSIDDILRANPGITDPSRVFVGQEIVVPNAEHHRRPAFGGGGRSAPGRIPPRVQGLVDSASGRFDELASDMRDFFSGLTSDTPTEPPWMETARSQIGVAERAGRHNANPRILEYFRASRYWGDDDSGAKNAWCGSFVAWVMQQNNIPPVNKAFRAKEWKNFGTRIDAPIAGAIGIKSRTGGGHVSFVVGRSEDGEKLYMLGGNQDDQVQITEYPANVWDDFVVPPNYDASGGTLPVYTGTAQAAGRES